MARVKKRGDRVIAFVETYCPVPEGEHVGQKIELAPFQKRFIREIYDNPAGTRRGYLSIARKNGKALALDTLLPTPSGWVTMGDIQEGDVLFDECGKPCRVTFATSVQLQRDCYRVRFADGSQIIADADHQWTVYSRLRNGRRMTLATEAMKADVILPRSRKTHIERNYSVDVAQAVECPTAEFLLPPYTLGVWLGDGDSNGAYITKSVADGTFIAAQIADEGTTIRRVRDCPTAARWGLSDGVKSPTKDCVKKRLRTLGVLGNKHIPAVYQRASIAQRMALLQGLMDTDGYASKAGQCEIVSVFEQLAHDILQLVRGLGYKASLNEDRAQLNGKDCGPRYRIQFWAFRDRPVFRLSRKAVRLKVRPARSRNERNYIVEIAPVVSVPVRCIQVDSPSGLFLAGEGFTPTHNTALIAGIMLAHLVGPEAKQNSQIVSGARSREQAGQVFNYASKMVQLSPTLSGLVRIVPSAKRLIGLARNVEYRALSAEGTTAHGLSPILAILDEVGQVKGPQDDFIDAITTAQGAHSAPLLIASSTQAAVDADLFSQWLDDAVRSADPRIVSHVYAAPKDAGLLDKKAWRAANPALGIFRNLDDLAEQAKQASRMPSAENTFRNLCLNQRVSMVSPFISVDVWKSCAAPVAEYGSAPVWCGLDLSGRTDLTALVIVGRIDGVWHVTPHFWTPEQGLAERTKRDRSSYDVWVRQGFLHTTPGATVDYEFVAQDIGNILGMLDVRAIAYDRWRIDLLQKELDSQGINLPLVEYGQGFKDMSPALDALESELLNGRLAHGMHPVLAMCASNAIVAKDPAGNRKLDKHKATGRIDGLVALAMAMGVAIGKQEDMNVIDSTYELMVV